MSEPVSHDVSTESLCTVIETSNNEYLINKLKKENFITTTSLESLNTNRNSIVEGTLNKEKRTTNGCLRNSIEDSCDTDRSDYRSDYSVKSQEDLPTKPRSKLKKSVSFDPNDEKIKKFISGEPIVDQQNPFKNANGHLNNGNCKRKEKKIPPPVPAKRSTLSVRKTVTQQLREREREKEKERERLKNETNNRKNQVVIKSPTDEFITTEEVLKQSKYVKTYIKNPDPYFVYDPTILARLKFEELKDLALKKPPKKLQPNQGNRERSKDANKRQSDTRLRLPLAFKKCSKPNYPDLSDLKIKTGTDSEGTFLNQAEVTKNAKKFDERIKKLNISSEDDIDDIEEPLTKSESSDEIIMINTEQDKEKHSKMPQNGYLKREPSPPAIDGTFTNTIKSKEFQEYLDKKGLTLIPKKIPNGAQPLYKKSVPSNKQISFKQEPECVQISSYDKKDAVDSSTKKPSVFQRLLANSIFASRRKTSPRHNVPTAKTVYVEDVNKQLPGHETPLKPIKRVVLERQSFHGRPKTNSLLSPTETLELKHQTERTRKSYASGDEIPSIIGNNLINGESNSEVAERPTATPGLRRRELQVKTVAKPPRRTLSRERVGKQDSNNKPISSNNLYSLPKENGLRCEEPLKRSLERQSMIPKRTNDRQQQQQQQIFARSSSMDRNEILKRNAARTAHQRSNSVSGEAPTQLSAITTVNTKENIRETTFPVNNGPPVTSTPNKETAPSVHAKNISPISSIPKKASQLGVYVDQKEWDKLRAIKEQTDRELYQRVMQQQQKLQEQQQQQTKDQDQTKKALTTTSTTAEAQVLSIPENIYEHLPGGGSQIRLQPLENNFTRGSPQRNTFSGITRLSNNRQVKIIDGKALITPIEPVKSKQTESASVPARCQSVLEGVTHSVSTLNKRGYESETPDTPVILRRKQEAVNPASRRIGGILTREEILQKIKEFCRKSLNKTPTNQQATPLQAIYEKQTPVPLATGAISTDLSPVSYVSVEMHQRPGSRMYATPQVPQRMHMQQAVAGHFVPIAQEMVTEANVTNSPIYAHVIKRGSTQSQQAELYEMTPRTFVPPPTTQYVLRRDTDIKPIFIHQGTMQRSESSFSPNPTAANHTTTQYILVDGDNVQTAQLVNGYPQYDLYAQPQYVRPHQLQAMPASYGYITVREPIIVQPAQPTHLIRPRLHDGRSTPLILDRSSQHVSQIYWSPTSSNIAQQQQQAGLLTDQISPRYAIKQPYAVPVTRLEQQLQPNRATPVLVRQILQPQQQSAHIQNVPAHQQRQYSPLIRESTPTRPQKLQQPQIQELTNANARQSPAAFDWESGSEAGEVQRIMEKQQQNGEFMRITFLTNLKLKMQTILNKKKNIIKYKITQTET